MKRIMVAVIWIAVVSLATQSVARGGWQEPTKISQYIIEGSAAGERFYVKFETDFNPDDCSGKDAQWKRVFADTEKGKFLLTAIVSAKATGQTVVPLMYGCDDWGRPVLTGLWVQ